MAEELRQWVVKQIEEAFASMSPLKIRQFWNSTWIMLLVMLNISMWKTQADGSDTQWANLETISETNVSRLSLLNSFEVPDCFVSNLSLSADGTMLAIGGSRTIQLWDVQTREPIRTVLNSICPDSLSLGVFFSPTAPLISYFDEENAVIKDVVTDTLQFSKADAINVIGFNGNGTLLATTDDTPGCQYESIVSSDPINCHYVSVWNATTGKRQIQLRGYNGVEAYIGAFSSNSRYLLFPHSSTILAWDTITGELAGEFDNPFSEDGSIATYDMATAGEWVFAGGAKGIVVFRADENGVTALDTPFQFSKTEDFPYDYPFSLEGIGNMLAIGNGHGKISFVQPITGEIIHSIQAYSQTEFIYGLEANQENKLLVAATRTGQIQVWGVPGE